MPGATATLTVAAGEAIVFGVALIGAPIKLSQVVVAPAAAAFARWQETAAVDGALIAGAVE